jgi:hypothetical protein
MAGVTIDPITNCLKIFQADPFTLRADFLA